jgi:hypothetical protein
MGIQNVGYLGDFAAGSATPITFKVSTFRNDTGAPWPPVGGITINVYRDSSFAQISSGITIIENFDGLAELVDVSIDISNVTNYPAGSNFSVVVLGGQVNGVALAPAIVASFSIQNRYIDLSTLTSLVQAK